MKISTGKNWRRLDGFGYGLFQPAVVGRVLLESPDFSVLGQANGILADMFSPDTDPPVVAPETVPEFFNWVFFWLQAINRSNHLPVLDHGRLVSFQVDAGRIARCVVALPWESDASRVVTLFRWLLGVLPVLHRSLDHGVPDEALKRIRQSYREQQSKLEKMGIKGVNTLRLIRHAVQYRVPVRCLDGGILRLGQGCHERMLLSTITDRTGSIGVTIARNKILTKTVLGQGGLPVPRHRSVANLQEALEAASSLGFPVVVKPVNLDGGEGVYAGLTDEESVKSAYDKARARSRKVMVEEHVQGVDYRITVVHGQVVKAIARKPGGGVGDGASTVSRLVNRAQQSPEARRRARDRGRILLSLDEEALEMLTALGLSPDSVLPEDLFVPLRRRANVSTGGTTEDVLPVLHPENARLATFAAELLRLDIAGVDIISPDISRSWMENRAAICEVNSQPQISTEFVPDVYRDLLQALFPQGPRIPCLLLLGDETDVDQLYGMAEEIAEELVRRGLLPAWYRNGELLLGNEPYARIDGNFIAAGTAVVTNPRAQAAVMVGTFREVLTSGLPTPALDGLYVTGNSGGDQSQQISRELWLLLRDVMSGGMVLTDSHVRDQLKSLVPDLFDRNRIVVERREDNGNAGSLRVQLAGHLADARQRLAQPEYWNPKKQK